MTVQLPGLYLPPQATSVDEQDATQQLREAASALYGVPLEDLPAADVTADDDGNRTITIPDPRGASE